MYAYIVDSAVQDRRLQAELFKVESRLAQLGIQGRIEKITILKNLQEAARDAVRRGATTLVAIGNDETVTKLLTVAIETNVTLGVIPLGEPQDLAKFLGIPSGAEACDIIARRIVRRLDVGKADSQYFLREARLSATATVECDGKYTVQTNDPNGEMVIGNLGQGDPHGQPTDGRLELMVQSRTSQGWQPWKSAFHHQSVFPIRKASIHGQKSDTTLILDGQVILKGSMTVEVAPKKLGVIVGRDRQF